MQQSLAFINQGAALAGVDEAGRGPLAGPVVAAAVILNDDRPIKGLKDSKLLSETRRVALAKLIRQHAKTFAVALAEPSEIDDINILQATLLAMERAVNCLRFKPNIIKVDGAQVPKFKDEKYFFVAHAVIHGDQLVPAISAASILAKVYRDRLMRRWHLRYPLYGFDSNKGYGTPYHLAALDRVGPCPIHRKSFSPVKLASVDG
jgi:ribonuclease HII|tara:strand:- start:360 stop:974 length:615 start_codon:yes stop_codon:yes gene_type:complete